MFPLKIKVIPGPIPGKKSVLELHCQLEKTKFQAATSAHYRTLNHTLFYESGLLLRFFRGQVLLAPPDSSCSNSIQLTASARYKSQVIDFTWLFCFPASSVCHLVCHQTSAVAGCNEMKLDLKLRSPHLPLCLRPTSNALDPICGACGNVSSFVCKSHCIHDEPQLPSLDKLSPLIA